MITEYRINSNYGFIGFAIILRKEPQLQGTLSLFETIEIQNSVRLFQQPSTTMLYSQILTDIDIIKNLMQLAIPTLRNNGLKYFALDSNNNVHEI